MMIEAELPDGTVLEFPEGTADDVVDRVVKQHLGVGASQPATPASAGAPAPDPQQAPASEGSFWDYVPIVSQARDVRDVMQQGFEPSDQFPYFKMPQSVSDRQERRDVVTDVGGAVVSGGTGGMVGATRMAAKGLIPRMVGSGIGTGIGEAAHDAADLEVDPKEVAKAAAFGAAGQGVGEAVSAVPGVVRHALRGGTDPAQVQAAIDDLGKFGATPSMAQATQSPAIDAAESLVSKVPGGTGIIRKAAEETNQKLAQGVEDIATKLAGRPGADPEMAGLSITKGIDNFASRFRAKGEKLFDEVSKVIPDDAATPMANTIAKLDELTIPVQGAEATSQALANPRIIKIADAVKTDAADGAMPFQQVRRLRSAIGRQLTDSSLISDIPRGELKQLYGALSEDIKSAAHAAGAGKQFDRANRFYAKGIERIEGFLDPLAKKNVPEQVFLALERGGKNGATQLRAIRKSVDPEQWNVMASASIRRLGKATPGQQSAEGGEFSFNTFLTNWNKLDPAAKSTMFSGPKMMGVRDDLDSIARAAHRIRESSKAFANPPNTASTLVGSSAMFIGAGSILTGNLALPSMLAMGSIAANGAARLMTSPKFVKWLANASKTPTKSLPAHLGRLSSAFAGEDEETQRVIQDYSSTLQQSVDQATTPSPEIVGQAMTDPSMMSRMWTSVDGNQNARRSIRRQAWQGLAQPTGQGIRTYLDDHAKSLRAIFPADHIKRVGLIADGMSFADGSMQGRPSRTSIGIAQFGDWLAKTNPQGAEVLMREALANPDVASALAGSIAVKAPRPGASTLDQYATPKLQKHMNRLGIIDG